MSATKDLNTSQKAVESAQGIFKKLDTMSKSATALAKEGKTLSQVDALLQDVQFFGKAATVFGAVGAGLGVITMIMGEKSAAEQNTALLTAIQGQISQLSTDMKRLFADQEREAHMIAAQARWDEKFSLLSSYHSRYDNYIEKQYDAYRIDLMQLDPLELIRQADELAEWMHQRLAQENILQAMYEYSFGNEGTILAIGAHVLQEAYFLHHLCLQLRDMAEKWEPARIQKIPPESEINTRFAKSIAAISEAIDNYARQCRDNCWNNVDQCLTHRIFPEIDLNWADYFTTNSKDIGEALQAQWPRYDWSVIVYDAVRGFDRHGVASNGIFRKDYWGSDTDEEQRGQQCKSGRANIIVAAASVDAHIFDPTNPADLADAWYDLTLNARATMDVQQSLAGFRTRNRNGLYFYSKREDADSGGVRMNFWSRAERNRQKDTRTNIVVYNQGTWEQGRILASTINLATVVDGDHRNTDIYYNTLYLSA